MNVIPTMEGVLMSVRITMAASPAHAVLGTNLNPEMTVTLPIQEDCVKVRSYRNLSALTPWTMHSTREVANLYRVIGAITSLALNLSKNLPNTRAKYN